ncbi:hypothetical protein I302_101191 [Kwoniella bestiolae CBS 10118]|uniref:Pre-mRNA-splicing factor SPF27 n=1 Tax=Kwoniella bestiolae CBS 10118 TaxID=1296100 RepID=A0A1B9G763_9TREE|nr:pre-mRNA-splicing factor SPF27 [Kwoniella bestiolae CBS 10118]OCF26874.1 pre-mRNA-splicing factor SPF27 [Kwoniella bestiolae CBS 10118]
MSSSTYIDSLPYYDKHLDDPHLKSAAQALIEAELRRTPQINDNDERLPVSVDVFPKSKQLHNLLSQYPSKPIRSIDPTKYQPPTVPDEPSLGELENAERQSKIAEGHMALRIENTSLLSQYAPNAWLIRNFQLNSQISELTSTLDQLKEQIVDVNRSRRVYQEEKGGQIGKLEGKWQDLISSNVQLEMACGALEGEVRGLRKRQEVLEGEVEGLERKG